MPEKSKPDKPRFRVVLIIEGEKPELVNERKRKREEVQRREARKENEKDEGEFKREISDRCSPIF